MKKVEVYSKGVVYCSVCADSSVKKKKLTKKVNEINPTLSHPWKLSKDKYFHDGVFKNGGPCNLHPNRRHYLFVC